MRIQEQKTIDIKVLQLYTTIMSLYTFPSGQWHIYDIICSYAERIETLVYIPTNLINSIIYTNILNTCGGVGGYVEIRVYTAKSGRVAFA